MCNVNPDLIDARRISALASDAQCIMVVSDRCRGASSHSSAPFPSASQTLARKGLCFRYEDADEKLDRQVREGLKWEEVMDLHKNAKILKGA